MIMRVEQRMMLTIKEDWFRHILKSLLLVNTYAVCTQTDLRICQHWAQPSHVGEEPYQTPKYMYMKEEEDEEEKVAEEEEEEV